MVFINYSAIVRAHATEQRDNAFLHAVNVADVTRNRFVSDIILDSKEIGK